MSCRSMSLQIDLITLWITSCETDWQQMPSLPADWLRKCSRRRCVPALLYTTIVSRGKNAEHYAAPTAAYDSPRWHQYNTITALFLREQLILIKPLTINKKTSQMSVVVPKKTTTPRADLEYEKFYLWPILSWKSGCEEDLKMSVRRDNTDMDIHRRSVNEIFLQCRGPTENTEKSLTLLRTLKVCWTITVNTADFFSLTLSSSSGCICVIPHPLAATKTAL